MILRAACELPTIDGDERFGCASAASGSGSIDHARIRHAQQIACLMLCNIGGDRPLSITWYEYS
jgi:hypothetical protein